MNTLQKTYDTMHNISNVLCKILSALVILFVIINLSSVLLQILNRHVVVRISDYSISWTEELARISMIWFAYLTLPLCYREGSMAQLDMLYDRFGRRGRLVLYLMSRVLVILFLVIVVKFGTSLVQSRMMFKSSMLRLPGYMMYSAPVVSCIAMGYEVITELVGIFAGILIPYNAGEQRNFPGHEETDAPMEHP